MSEYRHKFPVEVFWLNSSGVTNSAYYATTEEAEAAIASIKADNLRLGYTDNTTYQIRKRVPISRKGAGRKKE